MDPWILANMDKTTKSCVEPHCFIFFYLFQYFREMLQRWSSSKALAPVFCGQGFLRGMKFCLFRSLIELACDSSLIFGVNGPRNVFFGVFFVAFYCFCFPVCQSLTAISELVLMNDTNTKFLFGSYGLALDIYFFSLSL